jgi:hypothetical protein
MGINKRVNTVKKQQNKVYDAEGVLRTSYNLIPNLRKINSATFTDKKPNKNFRFIVDQTGVIVGHTGKYEMYYIDNYDVNAKNYNDIVNQNRFTWIYGAKNPNRLPKDKVNKLVNAQVKRTIYTKAFYKKYFYSSQPKITCKGDTGSCWYHSDNTITLKSWASDATILHELAHQRSAKHGRVFATNYLLLVGRFMDHGEQAKLVHSFRKWGVEFNGTFQHTNECLRHHGVTDTDILEKGYNNSKRCSQGSTKHFTITDQQLRKE